MGVFAAKAGITGEQAHSLAHGATPLPGTPVRGSRTGRPMMALPDLIGRRWTLRVLWELRAGPARFEELRGRCDEMSTSAIPMVTSVVVGRQL